MDTLAIMRSLSNSSSFPDGNYSELSLSEGVDTVSYSESEMEEKLVSELVE